MALEIYYPRKAMRCDSDARTEKRVALFSRTLFLNHFFTHTLFCIYKYTFCARFMMTGNCAQCIYQVYIYTHALPEKPCVHTTNLSLFLSVVRQVINDVGVLRVLRDERTKYINLVRGYTTRHAQTLFAAFLGVVSFVRAYTKFMLRPCQLEYIRTYKNA